ncbi:MAG: hypothetical protein KY459_02650 [Acidobacteria bacterium]|nr:hypothetical protein [Acidobacteriota bacterium]
MNALKSRFSLIATFVLVASAACTANQTTIEPDVPDEPVASVSKTSGAPGEMVTVTGQGFPPDTEVIIGAGPPRSEYDVIERGRTDETGRIERQVAIPRSATSSDSYLFVVATPDARIKALSSPLAVTGGSNDGDTITVTGQITDEGVECLAMRTEDGTLYTLGSSNEELTPGDRVRVTGSIAEMSFCMQGTTLNVTTLERL